MVEGQCHCGAVHWRIAVDPPHVVACTCSLCHRYGVLWGHGTEETVRVTAPETAMDAYVHGDRLINFHRCKGCGCVTHYTSRPGGQPGDRVSVNMRMAPRSDLARFQVRTFDGADTWAYLD